MISSAPEKDMLSLSVLGSKELDVGEKGHSSLDLPPQSVAFTELLKAVTHAIAKLK